MACADDARARAKATAINLIISFLLGFDSDRKAGFARCERPIQPLPVPSIPRSDIGCLAVAPRPPMLWRRAFSMPKDARAPARCPKWATRWAQKASLAPASSQHALSRAIRSSPENGSGYSLDVERPKLDQIFASPISATDIDFPGSARRLSGFHDSFMK
jgi:hypothetical protein